MTRLALCAAVWMLGCATAPAMPLLPSPSAGVPSTLLVISVPGMHDAVVGRESPALMPTVAALATAGVRSLRVTSVAPEAHYSAHATLMTGRAPGVHGIISNHPIDARGVREEQFARASALRVPTLWQAVRAAGGQVASFDWPSTRGADMTWLVPDVSPVRQGKRWLEVALEETSPPLRDALRIRGRATQELDRRGAARDAVLEGLACEVLALEERPKLVLLQLGASFAAWTFGPESSQARSAFVHADATIARLLQCVTRAKGLDGLAVAIVGSPGIAAVHTEIAPNAILAERGLRSTDRLGHWRALVRSNGGSAFVYARDERVAIDARLALRAAAERSRAFRIVAAREMIGRFADPEAWFGLEAEPGFAFSNHASGALLRRATQRGASGYFSARVEPEAAFVAWGQGVAQELQVPLMRDTDVALTLAALLDVRLSSTEGRAFVGLLAASGPAAVGREHP